MQINDVIAKVKECMVSEPDIAISMLRGLPEVTAAGLDDLVWSLERGQWGCHTNDVKGVVELLERHLTAACT